MKRFQNKPLPVILLTVFIDLLGFSIVLPILAPLLASPGQSPLLPGMSLDQRLIIFGLLVAVYPISQFISTPIIGQLSDRYGRKPLLAVSLVGTLIARILFIIAILQANLPLLFFSRIVDGLTGGNISVAQSSIADITTPENRAKNFGLLGAAFGFGFIIGPFLGGRFADSQIVAWFGQYFPNWVANPSTLPLWIATFLCAFNILLLFLIFPETLKEKITRPFKLSLAVSNFANAFKIKSVRATFITIFLFTFGFTFFTQYLSVYIQNKFEPELRIMAQEKVNNGSVVITIPPEINNIQNDAARKAATEVYTARAMEGVYRSTAQSVTSDLFSYVGVWIVISQAFLARILAKRFKPSTIVKSGLLVNGIAAILFLIPNQLSALFFIIPLFALSNGLISPNLQAIVSNSADAKSQGEILGGNQSISSLAQSIPPLLLGFLASIALNIPIIVSVVFTFLALTVFSIFYKPVKGALVHEQ